MAKIYLHPASARRETVARIQKETGLVATITGARVELVSHARWSRQFFSKTVRSHITDHGPGAA